MPSQNLAAVQDLYAAFARGDIAAVLGAMSPDIVWNEAENFPYADGNPYRGPEAILNGVFARIGGEWDGFSIALQELIDGGDTVIMLGRYGGTYKASGRAVDAQVAHVWRFAGGKAVGFQQYTDTLGFARATGAA